MRGGFLGQERCGPEVGVEGYFEGEGAVGVREYAGGDGAGEAVGEGALFGGGCEGGGEGYGRDDGVWRGRLR